MQTADTGGEGGPPNTFFDFTKASVLCPSCSTKNQTGEMGITAKQSQGGLRQGGRHAGGGLLKWGGNPGPRGGHGVASGTT